MNSDTFAVVAGGGTAGHVLPALSVAEALVERGHHPSTIHYMGAQRGIETRLLPDTPFPYTLLDVVGLQRSLTRRNLAFVPKMWQARRRAIELFRGGRPRVVVSVGGYASLPAVLAADSLDIPVVVVSYDLTPGRASRFAARRAAASAVAFPGSTLPNATMTGAPVRREILAVDRAEGRGAARAELGVPDDRFLVAVMGGSLGSGVLNTAVERLLDAHHDDRSLAVRHVVGERFLDDAREPLDGSGGVLYQPIGYEDRMPAVYTAADLLIGRGGASTVHEVSVTGTPAILVPWAASADDHQTANVRWLSDVGAAIRLDEDDLRSDRLVDEIDRLRSDPTTLAALGDAARERGAVHRSGLLGALIESVAR